MFEVLRKALELQENLKKIFINKKIEWKWVFPVEDFRSLTYHQIPLQNEIMSFWTSRVFPFFCYRVHSHSHCAYLKGYPILKKKTLLQFSRTSKTSSETLKWKLIILTLTRSPLFQLFPYQYLVKVIQLK